MLAFVALAIALSGCTAPTATPAASPTVTPAPPASATPTTSPAPTGQPSTAQAAVEIKDFAFVPAEVHIARGGTVTWTNHDSTTHTVRFNDGESPGFGNGGTYSRTFTDAGTYNYICGIHPSMTGKVVVE